MKRLVALPFHKSLEIAYKSIRVRFFRSLITTMSLVLAVAFFCFISVTNNIAEALLAAGDADIAQRLVKAGYDVVPEEFSLAASPKQRWIVFLSLLVCTVGIINAQLMSVTERFREIGTMKCLGALNRFIVRIFILEALMQGFVGSCSGALLGIFTAVAASMVRFGSVVATTFPWDSVFMSFLAALFTGTLLSFIGVLYPAIIAARMQPVEAMRVNQ